MTNILPETLRGLAVPLASLRPYPNNPRQGDIGAITESLKAHNQYRPVVVRRSDNTVLAGNHTLAAATALGWEQIAATFVDVDDDEAARIVLVDNRTSDLATNNPGQLAALLQELQATPAALGGTGYDGDALDELLADLGQMEPQLQGDPDAVPEAPEEPVTQPGDLWVLGTHRLLCGDSTREADVRRLMAGERADLLATDPPYLVDYTGAGHPQSKTNRAEVKDKDWSATYRDVDSARAYEFYRSFLGLAKVEAMDDHAAWYVWHADARAPALRCAWEDVGGLFHQHVIWVKSRPVLTEAHYMRQHEPCLYGWIKSSPPRLRPPANARTVWDIPSAGEEGGHHPTQKPAALFRAPIRAHSAPGAIVYDPFLGSGTTVAAAEMEGRRCFGLEIEPANCDVIVQRWETLTGKTAVRAPASARTAVEVSDHARVTTRA